MICYLQGEYYLWIHRYLVYFLITSYKDLLSILLSLKTFLIDINSQEVLMHLMKNPQFRKEEALTANGTVLIGDETGFYGISQGGILGGGFLGFTQIHKRAVLGIITYLVF